MTIEQFKTDEVILSNINQDTIPKQVVMQGEKDGRSLTVQVRNGGIVEPQAGLNLNLGWKHRTAKDKNGELIQGLDAFQAIDRENGIFRIEYASSMAQPGTIDAEIQFVTSTSITKSQPFIITVKPSTVDESAVESESSFTVLQEALTHVSQYDEKIEGLEISKADRKKVEDLEILKADKEQLSKVEDMVSKMPSATPKETFTSLAALQSKYPNGNASAMVVIEADGKTGYVYLWDGKTWIKGALYQSQGNANKSIEPRMTTFIKPKTNLFDVSVIVKGHYYGWDNNTTLKLVENGTFDCIKIPVEASQKYYLSQTDYLGFFLNNEGKIISTFGSSTIPQKELIIHTPSQCTAIAFSYKAASISPEDYIVAVGDSKPNEMTLDDTFVGLVEKSKLFESIPNGELPIEKLGDKAITSEKVEFILERTNLINLDAIEIGSYYSYNSGQLELKPQSEFWCGIFPIKEKTTYYLESSAFYCYITDSALNRMETFSSPTNVGRDIVKTTPANASYIIINSKSSVTLPEDYVLCEGDTKVDNPRRFPILNGVGVEKKDIVDSEEASSSEISVLTYDKSAKGEYKTEIRNWYEYPMLPVWGHEYLHSWYLKVFESQSIRIAVDGDSTTEESPPFWKDKFGRRVDIIAKMFKIAQYPVDKLIINNNGYGSRATGEWVGTGEFYSYESDKVDAPNGFLDKTMEQNPDLLIFGYGLNDASRNAVAGDSVEVRVNRFVRNLREGLSRIRNDTTETVNGRPCYGRNADDLAIILCTPIMSNNSPNRLRENWIKFLREEIRKLSREFKCGYCDFSMRHYDHKFSNMWSSYNVPPYYEKHDSLHPTPYANADFVSLLQDLILPVGLWKYDTSDVDIRFREEVENS